MSIATGSASKMEYQVILACNLNYIQDETYEELIQQVNEVKSKEYVEQSHQKSNR